MMMKRRATPIIIILLRIQSIASFQTAVPKVAPGRESRLWSGADGGGDNGAANSPRRAFLSTAAGALGVVAGGQVAYAGIDPNALKALPMEGEKAGTSADRMRQIEAIQTPVSDTIDQPYKELSNGVSYREYREGKGAAEIVPGSKVAAEMTIRCKSFATNKEPGGLKYFSTKEDTDFNEVAFLVGSGEFPPGLEEAMMGMHRNSIRRIELPSVAVFSAKKAGQLPLPTTKDGKRTFDNLFKTDATLLFEVLVTRIK